jgi:S1-C subfamily serine protease
VLDNASPGTEKADEAMTEDQDPNTSDPVAPNPFAGPAARALPPPPQAPGTTHTWALPPPVPVASAPPPPAAPPPRRRRIGWWIGGAIGALALLALIVGAVVVVTGGDEAAGRGPCPDADGRSGELRRCLGPSMVFIATDFGTGSGVLIDGGYVVTNVHVVDPFGAADVTFTDGERHEDVQVVGIDAFTDIAVLGPIDTDRTAVAIETQPVDEGTDEEPEVFLVGFPGGVEDDEPAITIAGGLLSRTRTDDTLGLTYLQSDAAISGGQSGGALVDGSGRLLGISGLSFAETFALVLSAGDVRTSVDRILAGDGDTYAVIGGDGTAQERTFELTALSPVVSMVLEPAPSRREIEVTADADQQIGIEVASATGDLWAINQDLRDTDPDWYVEADSLESAGEGRYTFELPSDEYGIVSLTRLDHDATVTLDADVSFTAQPDVADAVVVSAGETRGVLQAFTTTAVHEIELQEGDVVEIAVSAGSSDPYFTLLAPGEDYDIEAEPQADDGGGGLYDLDSFERFEIDESGAWRIVVSTWDGYTTGYVLTITVS